MESESPAYGLWSIVILNAAFFIFFAFSFAKPRTSRDWRSFGAFSAFLFALFTEMYGFPLTLYLLSGWLARRYPDIDLLSHDAGHLWATLLGSKGNPHWGALHLLSSAAIAGGFILLSLAWKTLYDAQRSGRLAKTGVYSRVRHPQYLGFILIMLGFLLQWPTLVTLAMFPVLIIMYVRLGRREEEEAIAQFGDEYRRYRAAVPGWIPAVRRIALPMLLAAFLSTSSESALAQSSTSTIPLSKVAHIHGVAVDPTDPTRLYLATHQGLYLASPDGTAWQISRTRDDLMGFTTHPKQPKTFYASGHPERGGNLGFVVSEDGGVTWRQVSPGLHGPVDFHQMAISPSDPAVIYGAHHGLQRSADGGKTWTMVGPAPDRLIDLAVSPRDPNTLHAATETGLLVSDDGGKAWRPATPFQRPATMVESTANGVYAYIVGIGLIHNDGGTWARLGDIGGDQFVLHFAKAGERFYAVTHKGVLLASNDGGKTWRSFVP